MVEINTHTYGYGFGLSQKSGDKLGVEHYTPHCACYGEQTDLLHDQMAILRAVMYWCNPGVISHIPTLNTETRLTSSPRYKMGRSKDRNSADCILQGHY